jgi:hypothetical protein
MPDGGFLVKFVTDGGKSEDYFCYSVAFDYDEWTYKLNDDVPKPFPPMIKIEVIPQGD